MNNGQLLAAAEAGGFDLFLTADQSLRYQQNFTGRRIAIIELPTNRLSRLSMLAPALLAAMERVTVGGYEEIVLP